MDRLSGEEKKAIDYYINNEYSFSFETDMDMENLKKAIGIEETDEDTWEKHQIRFKTLLNLIEKQEKEIDRLQNIKRKDIQDLINNENENIYKNYISKDEIRKKQDKYKNKIEKLESKKIWNEPVDTINKNRYTNYFNAYEELLQEGDTNETKM